MFRDGHLSTVIGLRLDDGRHVVVKVRAPSPRLGACLAVHRHLFAAGYPCPQPLTDLEPLDGSVASAEAYLPGDAPLPTSGRSARLFAEPLARLIRLAPAPDEPGDLGPAPAWVGWSHDEGRLWPAPDDLDVDLNDAGGPAWIDEAGRLARARLQADGAGPAVVGHGDWYTGNLRWRGDDLVAVHDWDSVIADSEAAVVGFAAAVFPTLHAGDEATVAESAAFLEAYQAAIGRPFSDDEVQRSWAAGVWLRAFDAKKQHAAGQPVRSLTEAEAGERLRRALASR